MRRHLSALSTSLLFAACASTAPAPPASTASTAKPARPSDAARPAAPAATPAARGDVTLRYEIRRADRVAGGSTIVRHADGSYDEDYAYEDRGRGPKLHTHTTMGDGPLPVRIETSGQEYMHRDVHEVATCDARRCTWANDREHGEGPPGFYIALYSGAPDEVLLRAARSTPDGTLPLLPGGALRVARVAEATLNHGGERRHVVAWEYSGFDLQPFIEWFDDDGTWFGHVRPSSSTLREGWADAAPQLLATQQPIGRARRERIAARVAHTPSGGLAIVHARVFDPAKRTTIDDATIVIEGARVKAVTPRAPAPPGHEVIDAAGKTVLPGLWDMHVHLDDDEGLQHVAEGVTTARDLGNDMESSLTRRARWDAGAEIGPHVILAGIIDGRGPLQVPFGAFISSADEARAAVDRYAANGYAQIKIYSSVPPELVPVIVREAHAKGLRVSGHVPAHMIAEDAIAAGFDELQHVNFLMLDLLGDRAMDTRTPLRFTLPAERAADVDLDAPRTKALIDALVAKRTVVDPTLSVFEDMFTNRPDHPSQALAPVIARLPPQAQRMAGDGAITVPEGMDARFHESFRRCEQLVKRLWDRHVPIVAGTDSFAGFALHRELELYAEAGIPNADVLALATLGAARVMKRDATSGSIAPGKDADLVIVDGDPLKTMRDVRNVVTVVKSGTVIDARAAEEALSIAPRGGR